MEKYLIKYTNKKGQDADFKAREDVFTILKSNNFNIVNIPKPKSKLERVSHPLWLSKYLKEIKEGSKVVVEWPIINHTSTNRMIKVLKEKKCDVILVIHDFRSLRFHDDDYISTDIGMFNKFDAIISHNKHMSKWLIENGLKTKCVDLEIFDYSLPEKYADYNPNYKEKSSKHKVAFAGNLGEYKSGFLYKLKGEDLNNVELKLYGPNVEMSKLDNSVEHLGSFGPEEITANIDADYGLLWDGESVKVCEGSLGRYLKFNNPHKVSLYIASRLPVIVWEQAAIADFILENNIGITIKSLDEISTKLDKVENYEEMKANIEKIRRKLINGEYLLNAVEKACK